MNPSPRRTLRQSPILLLTVLAGGCATQSEIRLRQPFAPPAQKELLLTGKWAYFTTVSGGRQTLALAYPLPGSLEGPRAFVLYLNAPARTGTIEVNPDDVQAARGFLIQELGTLAGRSDFAAGTIKLEPILGAPRYRTLTLDIRTEDGAVLSGQATLEELAREVLAFEREFAADVAQLSESAAPAPEVSPPDTQPSAAHF